MILVSAAVLLIGWSVLWLFARREAQAAFDTWIAAERAEGRTWTCPDRRIGGYPLGIVIRCDRPTFADAADNGLRGSMAALTAEAQLYFPTNVMVRLQSPMDLREPRSGTDLALTWVDAHLSLRGEVPGDLDRGQLEADGLTVTPAGGAATRIGHVELGFKPLPQATPGPLDVEAVLKIAEAASPEADAAFGSPEPIAASAILAATKLPSGRPDLPLLLDAWRVAGGDLALKNFRFVKGSFVAEGDGHAELDEEHRVEGRLDARFSGLEPVAARFGIPLGAVKIGGLLSGLLGGKPAPDGAPQAELTLPIVARNGRLSIGPVKTGITLTPLY